MEPPKTRVLDIKDVVQNQIDILEHRNGVKIPKILVLDLNEWIEIFQLVCLESYYSETFNQMHANTFPQQVGCVDEMARNLWKHEF